MAARPVASLTQPTMVFTVDMIDESTVLTLGASLNQANFMELLKFLSSHYHNGPGLIEDATFETLVDMYQARFGPYNVVGAPPTGAMVDLPYYLGSLDKVKKESELANWTSKHPGPYIIEDKVDGLTLLLVCHCSGKTSAQRSIHLFTRGGGTKGMDVSHLAPYLKLPNITEDIAIRGEIVITKEAFARIVAAFPASNFKNARNVAAGAVKAQKQFNPALANEMSFFCYRILNGNLTPSQDILRLNAMGFLTPSPVTSPVVTKEILEAHLSARKAVAPYEMDGLVVYQDVFDAYPNLANPKHVIAFKTETDTAVTTVLEVKWEASKDRLLKPVVHYETVNLSGSDLKKATAYNARFVVLNNLGPGAKILLTRSGDVIPKILSVVTPSPSGPSYPDPRVHGAYNWNENQVEFVLAEDNDQVTTNKIRHFLETLEIRNAGPTRVKALVDGGINTISKLLSATPAQLRAIDGIGAGLSQQYVTDIRAKITQADPAMIMDASGIFEGVGEKRFNLIFDAYPRFLDYVYYDVAELAKAIRAVPGFKALADKIAERMRTFGDWLKQHPQITIGERGVKRFSPASSSSSAASSPRVTVAEPSVESVTRQVTTLRLSAPVVTSGNMSSMAGLTIVFSGFRSKELEQRIIARGGKVTTAISRNTSMLVMKDVSDKKGKALEAEEKGIPLISQDDFMVKYF